MTKNKRLYLTTGYQFKLRYSHSTYQIISAGERLGLFSIKSNGGTVHIGSVIISVKYVRVEHEFEGLTFTDKHRFDDIEIIHPNKQ